MANRKDFVVFWLGKFGRSVAQTLAANGCDVLAIDKNEETSFIKYDKLFKYLVTKADNTEEMWLVASWLRLLKY